MLRVIESRKKLLATIFSTSAGPVTNIAGESAPSGFHELGLGDPLLQALAAVGYEKPSQIQARAIPLLLAGSDVLGQAQTGTGKTAAFALPILAQIDLQRAAPQALVLVPTRELAIQVAEAFQRYATGLPGFHVLPIYGGQSYVPQLKGLKRGAHAIVGTPGRVLDHVKSGALRLETLRFIVLDEGDEMLQMGFVDDIEWLLEQAPSPRQIALFSATMPPAIRRIAQRHMREPAHVTIQNRAGTQPKIRQRYWLVSGLHKLDALTRVLEAERFEAMLVFVRTKLETTNLAERLEARGFNVAALNGDIPQQQRERTIARLKSAQVDIVVATDVAARGLDVERISHVVNYDIPYDSETYIHRIGRTGRAGRSGDAILFVAPRERNMLRIIERVTGQRIEPMRLPSIEDVNEQRAVKLKERILNAVQAGEGKVFRSLIEQIEHEGNIPAADIAAALASLLQGPTPFLLPSQADAGRDHPAARSWTPEAESAGPASAAEGAKDAAARGDSKPARDGRPVRHPKGGIRQETFRVEVGHTHEVQPGNLVGAIANEAGVDGRHIGHIDIRDDHSFVDLPVGMPKELFEHLRTVRVRGVELRISRVDSKPPRPSRGPGRSRPPKRGGKAPRRGK
ncbi:MAG TPA: DEAD/DEAH box helicase [Steroidobacteraceae bacterium]|nr:DEAD/DEAH box helicase [Steroidobacteraceae bacterium]